MELLNRSDYNHTVHGSDKIYYGAYPYKVKLTQNEITADWQVTADIMSWRTIGEDALHRRMSTKSVNNWTKNYYFNDKNVLDSFVDHLDNEHIDHISGPISEHHCEVLQEINRENKYGEYTHVIKANNYFDQYDMKLIWKYPRSKTSYYENSLSEYFNKLGESIMGVCDSRYYDRNVYFKKEDLEDIEFFCKLKYGDVIQSRVEVIVIDNM